VWWELFHFSIHFCSTYPFIFPFCKRTLFFILDEIKFDIPFKKIFLLDFMCGADVFCALLVHYIFDCNLHETILLV